MLGILHIVGPLKVLAEQTVALNHLIYSQTVLNLPVVSDFRKITLFSVFRANSKRFTHQPKQRGGEKSSVLLCPLVLEPPNR